MVAERVRREADAARIVQCCNSHDALVEALKGMLSPEMTRMREKWPEVIAARAALRKAGVE